LQAVLRANGMPLWDANGSYHPISHDVMWNFPNRWSHFFMVDYCYWDHRLGHRNY
jgi:hypothetical protein